MRRQRGMSYMFVNPTVSCLYIEMCRYEMS